MFVVRLLSPLPAPRGCCCLARPPRPTAAPSGCSSLLSRPEEGRLEEAEASRPVAPCLRAVSTGMAAGVRWGVQWRRWEPCAEWLECRAGWAR